MKETEQEGLALSQVDTDAQVLESQLTDSNKPPEITAAPKEDAPQEAPPLPPVGRTRLVSGSATLTSGGAPYQLRAPDATRAEVHLIVTSETATDEVRVASAMGDAAHDLTSFLIPTDIEVVLRDFTGPIWVALATDSTGPAKITTTSVVA